MSTDHFVWFCFAEAPCSHAVDVAKAAVRDKPNDDVSPALREFAAIKNNDAEEACHKLFEKYRLCSPVKVNNLNLGPGELRRFPFVCFSEWVKHLMDTNRLENLCGVPAAHMEEVLTEFWTRYEVVHPNHQIFEAAREGELLLSRTIPVFAHMDEGRTYKSKALLILSVHGAIGKGTNAYCRRVGKIDNIAENPLPMNYIGNTWTNQFMICSILRTAFKSSPEVLNTILARFSEDLENLEREGVTNSAGTEHVHVQLLGLKADLPALKTAGNMVRSYNHGPKQAVAKTPCNGICFLCLAGRESPMVVPFEDFRGCATWKSTCHVEFPWDHRPAILGNLRLETGAEAGFFKTDLWHNWHNGMAKAFIASVFFFIVLTAGMIPENNIEAKFAWLTRDYLFYCRRTGLQAYLRELTRDTFGYDSSKSTPMGSWNKAAVSTHLMLYLEDFCSRFVKNKTNDFILCSIDSWFCFVDMVSLMNVFISTLYGEGYWIPATRGLALGRQLRKFLVMYMDCASLMNVFISTLYGEGYWIPATRGLALGRQLRKFLVMYMDCAREALKYELSRFSLLPKSHMLAPLLKAKEATRRCTE
eukprot:s6514_g2.t1